MPDEPMLDASEAATALQAATAGLLYLSETDAPFELVTGDTAEHLIGAKGPPAQTLSIDAFFAPLTKDEPWHKAQDQANVQRYRHLRRLFAERLRAPQVLRYGRIAIDVFIIGHARDGRWVGLKTKAVET